MTKRTTPAAAASDVWSILKTIPGMDRACNKVLSAYYASEGRIPAAAQDLCDERLRQWRRITTMDDTGELTFAQIADCLGWTSQSELSTSDAGLVHCITERLLQQLTIKTGPNTWYTKRGSSHYWSWKKCLLPMRLAAIFVSRLRMGDADLRFLAADIRRCTAA